MNIAWRSGIMEIITFPDRKPAVLGGNTTAPGSHIVKQTRWYTGSRRKVTIVSQHILLSLHSVINVDRLPPYDIAGNASHVP